MSIIKKDYPSPPTPNRIELLEALKDWPHNLLSTLSRIAREHGDIVRLRFGPETRYLLNHPDYIKQVMQDNARNYTKESRDNTAFKHVVGEGLATTEGALWRQQRRLSQPAFHRQRIEAYARDMVNLTLKMLDRWQTFATQNQPLHLNAEMQDLTIDIVSQTLFSHKINQQMHLVREAFIQVNEAITLNPLVALFPWLPTFGKHRFKTAIDTLDLVAAEIVQGGRRRTEVGDDLLSMLLTPAEKTRRTLSDRQIRNQVRGLLLAGHETSSAALGWLWYLLEKHPVVAERLYNEIDTVLQGRNPTIDDLSRLTYTRMVILETLRLYPPAWALPRLAGEADVVGGYPIPTGSTVWVSSYLIHRHPEFWPRPELFNPERFTSEQIEHRPRHAYIPFSTGQRMCLGDHFAMVEMQIIVALIAQRYRLKLLPGYEVELQPMLIIHPTRQMMTLHSRL